MIFGYKLSGMNNPNILALLIFALAELVLDRDSSPELVQLIQSEMSPSNPPPAAPAR